MAHEGSEARGDTGPHSDVDFDVLTTTGPREEYLAYFVESGEGWLTHVSVAVHDLEGWLVQEAEPAEWAFPWSAAEATRQVWTRDETLRERLARPFLPHAPAAPELEDFIADFGKVKNAHAAISELALRLAAQGMAQLCPSLLRLVNPEVRVGTRYQALLARPSISPYRPLAIGRTSSSASLLTDARRPAMRSTRPLAAW